MVPCDNKIFHEAFYYQLWNEISVIEVNATFFAVCGGGF